MSYSNTVSTLAMLVSGAALAFAVYVFWIQRDYVEEEQRTRVLCQQFRLGVHNESASKVVDLHNLAHSYVSIGEAKVEPNRTYVIPNEERRWSNPKDRPMDVVESSLSLEWIAEDLDRKRFVFCKWEHRAYGLQNGTLVFLWTEPRLIEERYSSEEEQTERIDPERYQNPIRAVDGMPIKRNPPRAVSTP